MLNSTVSLLSLGQQITKYHKIYLSVFLYDQPALAHMKQVQAEAMGGILKKLRIFSVTFISVNAKS